MKKLLYTLVFAFLVSCSSENDLQERDINFAIIKGEINNPDTNFVILNHVYYNDLLNDTIYLNDNSFEFKVETQEGTFYNLKHGINLSLYAEPADTVVVSIDLKKDFDGVYFEGDKKLENEYLLEKNQIDRKISEDKDLFEELWKSEYDEFDDVLSQVMEPFKNNFEQIATKEGVSENFLNLAKKLIDFREYNYKSDYPLYYSWHNDYEKQVDLPEGFLSLDYLNELEFPELLARSEYHDFLKHFNDKVSNEYLEDENLENDQLAIDLIDLGERITEKLKDTEIREIVLPMTFSRNIMWSSEQYNDEVFDWYSNHLPEENINEVREIYEGWMALSEGTVAQILSGYNLDGENIATSDFEGEYIYIDVWATWCGPCRNEIPYLEELQEKFKDENVRFISLSTDENIEAWEEIVENEGLKGTQIIAKDEDQFDVIRNEYLVYSIPRFILIGPDGKIVDANAPRPSENIDKILEELLSEGADKA